jgi:hypothetical protein
MDSPELESAVAAAKAAAGAHGLQANDAVVLHNSNRIAVHLLPCDTLARVARRGHHASAQFEVELAGQLAAAGAPIAPLEPRVPAGVYGDERFTVTFWSYFEPVPAPISPREYADALARHHAALRHVQAVTPHFTDRVAEAQRHVGDRRETPELAEGDRAFLADTLARLKDTVLASGAPEQLLHGEPHPGNLLNTAEGPLFVDLETACRGPVEFDLAHTRHAVHDYYPGLDRTLLRNCELLMFAMICTWRWQRGDELPGGREMGLEFLARLRGATGQ